MLRRYLEFPEEFKDKIGIDENFEKGIESIMISLPKNRFKVKTFLKWRDNLLNHLRNNMEACEKFCVGIGIEDGEIATFIERLLVEVTSQNSRVFLLIDNFDLPLLQASADGYIKEALHFYKMLFPDCLIQCKNIVKIIVMASCHVDIPGCLTNHSTIDPSLFRTTINSDSIN